MIGPLLLILLRVIDVIKKVSTLGFGNNYYCNLSTDAKCSLSYYVFKSDDAVVSYVGIIVSFIFLLVVTSYVFFLIKIYKENRLRLFWTLVSLTAVVLIACPFVINYIQLIS